MKKLSNILLMAGVAFLATLTITSCNPEVPDTNPLNKKGVNLVAYGPNPVARGGYLRMMGTGLDQVKSVTIADQALDSLVLVSNEELKALVPQTAKIGNLVLTTKGGDTITGRVKITYTEPVGFDAEKPFEPATIKAGQMLTINGEYLNLVTKVILSDGVEVTKFKEQDRKHIVIEKLPAEAQTGSVILSFVATGDTIAQEIPSEAKLDVVLPTVSEIRELTEVKAGEQRKVSGGNLDLVTAVLSPTGDSLEYSVSDNGWVLTMTMPEVVMDGTIYIVTASGIKIPVATINVALPKVAKVEPATGLRAGDVITITGNDFGITSTITFATIAGTVAAEPESVSPTQITVKMPETAISGNITINTTANIDVNDEKLVIETLKPALTEFAPAEVPMGGVVALNGTDLDLVKTVTLTGGAVLTPTDVAATTLNITIPYAEAETGKVTLTMANGETVETTAELTITSPAGCYATAWPDPELEIKAGTMMVITVANIDKLTAVKIDGQECQIIKLGDQLYIAVPDAAGKNSVITLVSDNGDEIPYSFAFVPNTEQKRSLWKGTLPISWSDDGKIHVAASAMAEVPVGAELVMCYTQVDQTWGQAQMCFGDWSMKLLPDGTTTTGDGALVPTDIYGWFSDGVLYRETAIVLSEQVLADMRAHVDGNGDILHIQGSDLIFNEIYVRWTISLEVDCAPFIKYENQEGTFAYPYYPSWSDNSGKLRLFRNNGLQDLNLKAGKSKIIFYKEAGTTGQIQFCNPNWSALTTVADWDGSATMLEYVFDEEAIKCVTGETADGWSETAFVMQGDGLTVTKITILP